MEVSYVPAASMLALAGAGTGALSIACWATAREYDGGRHKIGTNIAGALGTIIGIIMFSTGLLIGGPATVSEIADAYSIDTQGVGNSFYEGPGTYSFRTKTAPGTSEIITMEITPLNEPASPFESTRYSIEMWHANAEGENELIEPKQA